MASPIPWHATEQGFLASASEGFVPLATPFAEHAWQDDHGMATSKAIANARLVATLTELVGPARFALSVLEANPVELSERMAIDRLYAIIDRIAALGV